MINILFICKHNRFRSKVAEAYFNKINKNPKINVKSAGLIAGYGPVKTSVRKVIQEFGIILKGNPQGISKQLLKWADVLVIVAKDVPPSIFTQHSFKGKLIVWKIKDAKADDLRDVRRATRQIIEKVDKFVKTLK